MLGGAEARRPNYDKVHRRAETRRRRADDDCWRKSKDLLDIRNFCAMGAGAAGALIFDASAGGARNGDVVGGDPRAAACSFRAATRGRFCSCAAGHRAARGDHCDGAGFRLVARNCCEHACAGRAIDNVEQ